MEAREGRADAQVELAANVHGVADALVGLDQVVHRSTEGRRRHVRELRPLDGNVRPDRPTHVDDLVADVLAFAIAIRPDDESAVARPHLPLERLLDLLEVLRAGFNHWRVEQLLRVATRPISVSAAELERQQVAGHGRENYFDELAAQIHLELVDFVKLRESFALMENLKIL